VNSFRHKSFITLCLFQFLAETSKNFNRRHAIQACNYVPLSPSTADRGIKGNDSKTRDASVKGLLAGVNGGKQGYAAA
jgi:hypothetical protein